MKKVSVVIPCYNAAGYLDKCIEQLLNQTIGIDNIEIILVDDASTDGEETRNLIRKYEEQFPNTVLAVFLEENMRQGGARNAGVFYAKGEYLTFCDADDWLLEEALEHAYDTAKKYNADIVAFARKETGERDVYMRLEKGSGNKLFELSEVEKKRKFLLNMDEEGYSSQNKLFRLSLLHEKHIAFAEHLIMEEPSFVLPVRLYAERYYYLDEKLYVYYLSTGSTLRSGDWEKRKWDNLQVWVSLIEDLRNRDLLFVYWQEIEYLFFMMGLGWSLAMMFQRGCILNGEEWKIFANIVYQMIPTIRENPYVKKESHPFNQAWNSLLLAVLDMEFSDADVAAANRAMIESAQAFSACPVF